MGRVAAELRERVYRANKELAESGLVMGTFGNVSEVDRGAGLFVIKPSGVPYESRPPTTWSPSLSRRGRSWTASSGPPPTLPPTSRSTAPSAAAGSSTPTPRWRPPSRRRGCRCAAWGRPTPTTSAGTCP